MDWDHLKWKEIGEPVTDDQIRHIESLLNVQFPADFVDCAKKYHGAYPEVGDFKYTNEKGEEWGGSFAHLFSLDLNQRDNIVNINHNPPEGHILGLMMFGESGGAGLVCLDYRVDPKNHRWCTGFITIALATSFFILPTPLRSLLSYFLI